MNNKSNVPSPLSSSTDLIDEQAFAADLLRGMTETRSVVLGGGGGPPLLKMSKHDGSWSFGQTNEPYQEGAHLMIAANTIGWGWEWWPEYQAGNKAKPVKSPVVSVGQPMPPCPAPISGRAFNPYVCFSARIIDGDDADTMVMYGSSTKGGVNAWFKLKDLMFARLQRDQRYFCPVVTLDHTFNADVYYPVFNLTGWADLRGNLAPTGTASKPVAPPEAAQAAPAASAEPARKRKAPLAGNGAPAAEAAPAPAAEPEGPIPTQQAHTGQRRRHRPAA